MPTPLDQLAERYGPEGEGARKPCKACRGTGLVRQQSKLSVVRGETDQLCTKCLNGTVLDETHPLFEALYEPCWCHPSISGPGLHPPDGECGGTGYVRRSCAEAVLRLPDAVEEAGWWWEISRYLWAVTLWSKDGSKHHTYFYTSSEKWFDALAQAILEAEKVKEVNRA